MHVALEAAPRRLASSEEAGTAPDDRRFRPDVEGLRAVAILLVVLYHAGVPHLTGGYIGVDVFFVISGFVITGLLLRERHSTGRTSIRDFYARRCRRILPAATLVILITVALAYVGLGVASGNSAADDGRWAAVFLSNFHFARVGTDYFAASLPPSPLQNFWSLSVEEQFYVVYPTLFLVVAGIRSRMSFRARMTATLVVVFVASFWLSVAQTASQPTTAYFSPFTRFWELALGALVAVATTLLKEIPRQVAFALTWAGLAAIIFAAFSFTATTTYPGSLAAVPVLGAALIIAGGASVPRAGAESLLGLRPFQWMGRRSYSLYLWHWPILILAAERNGKSSLTTIDNLLLVIVALGISMVTYAMVENPIRHWKLPATQSVLAGIVLVIVAVTLLTLAIFYEGASDVVYPLTPAPNSQLLVKKVSAASRITVVPKSIEPPLSLASTDLGEKFVDRWCIPKYSQAAVPICTLGDVHGQKLMVVYGDSHALMWLPVFQQLATNAHWRLVMLGKPACPAVPITPVNPPHWSRPNGPYVTCTQWHRWAVQSINRLRPNMLIVTDRSLYESPSRDSGPPLLVSTSQWRAGIEELFASVKVSSIKKIVLGNTPELASDAPECLMAHPQDVQACSASLAGPATPYYAAEQAAANVSDAGYVDTRQWFCSTICTAIVGPYVVYSDNQHVTATYARYLGTVLGQELGFG